MMKKRKRTPPRTHATRVKAPSVPPAIRDALARAPLPFPLVSGPRVEHAAVGPGSTVATATTTAPAAVPAALPAVPRRRRLPETRGAVTRKLSLLTPTTDGVEEIDLYVTVGLYEDGTPGELFIRVGRQGGTLSGFADAVALCMSIGLQYGVPLEAFTGKLRHLRFEPAGRTRDPAQPSAESLLDLLAGWLERRFSAPPDVPPARPADILESKP